MNRNVLEYLICPDCGSENLTVEAYSLSDKGEIGDGRIICPSCKRWYRIEGGIADLLPAALRRMEAARKFAEKYKLQVDDEYKAAEPKSEIAQMRFFEENVDDYESQVANSSYYQALDHIAFLDWINRKLSGGNCALDLGSGTGRQCIPLAQNRIRTISIDISQKMLSLARKKADRLGVAGYIDFIIGDAKHPPVKDNIFDACIFYGTLHHLDDPAKAIENASKKIKRGGLFFSLDPHASPVRFIFDLMMKFHKLYDEKASDNPLLSETQLKKWLSNAGIRSGTRLSTYIPPHLCYILSVKTNIKLLKASDWLFNKVGYLRKLGGVIIAEGVKE